MTSGETIRRARWRVWAVAAFALLSCAAGVFSLPPLDRDESRFAQATAQMLESGDFIAIRFQADERNKKPVGIHWLQAASVAAFSSVDAREIWAYRLPSIAGAVLAALFTYWIGARLYGAQTGFFAALLLASAPALVGESTIAKTDAMLLATIAGAQWALVHIVAAIMEKQKPALITVAGFWIAVGAGLLIKGPIILIVVGASLAAIAARGSRFELLAGVKPLFGAVILIAMAAPWAIAVDMATDGRFFAEAVGGDMLAKISAAQESHAGPPGYYLALLFALFWPAAALIPAAAREAFADRNDWRCWFLISWIAPSWIIFELTATKLPHYTLPLYPAIAIFVARAATRYDDSRGAMTRRAGAVIYALVGAAFASLIVIAPRLYRTGFSTFDGAAPAAGFAIAVAATTILFWRSRARAALTSAIFVSSAMMWTILAGAAPELDRLHVSPRLSAAVEAAGLHPLRNSAPSVALAGYREPSAIFLLGTHTILTDGRGAAELEDDAPRAVIVEKREEPIFLQRTAELGSDAEPLAVIGGLNYSNGDEVLLRVYRVGARTQKAEAK